MEAQLVHSESLLPANLEQDRIALLANLNAAYSSVMTNRTDNWRMWQDVRLQVTGILKRRFEDAGITAPPWNLDALWARIDLPHPSRDPNAHLALVRALLTNYGARFWEHIRYRMENDGNLHIELVGGTGMAKSSCAITLADAIHPIAPDRLVEHLSRDVSDLPARLAGKSAGETVIQDEFVQVAGDGAATVRNLFTNLEDTLRASQVNLLVLSPRRQDHGTMQATLEAILWNPERGFTVFLVWLEGIPHGVIALPWAKAALWEAYKPWKQESIERTLRGQFRDNAYIARLAVAAFADERLVQFLLSTANKPTRKDFHMALDFFQAQMMASTQVDRMASFMYDICYAWDRVEPHFESWFGVKANNGLKRVAVKCYQE